MTPSDQTELRYQAAAAFETLSRYIADEAMNRGARSWPTGMIRDKIEAVFAELEQSLRKEQE